MNVIIRVVDTGEVLDLFSKVALENTITSAFLSEDGSKAIPISLPITDKNTRIFGFSKRIDRANKGNKEIDVIVSKGSYSRKGKLYLSSSSNSEWSYSATIAYNEAILYDLQSKLKLTQLPTLPIEHGTVDEFIAKMYRLLTVDDIDNALTVFQVYLKNVGTWKQKQPGNDDFEMDITEPFVLNENKKESGEVKFILKDKITVVKDDKPLKIPAAKGIGLTPFVHVWYVVERIAEHYGYTMGENQMKEDPQLIRATLLNNTADAIVGGFLDYKQLMPEITISEFFQFLWARFGAKVFIDGNTNTMNIKLLKNCINEKEVSQLPISGFVDVEHSQPKQLKLSASRNLEASGTETDTYEEFCAKYNNTIGNFHQDYWKEGIGGIVLDPARGLYYHAPMSELDESGKRYDAVKPISSFHFDWDKKDEGLEYVEITSPDECLTAAWYDMDGRHPYYGVDFALKNSRMQVDRKIENRDETNRLAVCWDMGQYYYGDGLNRREEQGWKFGSIQPYMPNYMYLTDYYYDKQGNRFKYALTWIGKDGCFEHFWKDYDAILRHSGDVVKGKIYLQPFELSSLDISKPYIVANQKILLQDYSYIIGNIDVERQEFNAITLGLYLPHDLEKEQSHPKPDPILYKWALMTDKQEKLDIKLQSIIDGFEETAYKKFVSCEWTKIEDNNPPNMDGLAYYPPSKAQVESEDKIGESKHDLKATYKLKWKVWTPSPNIGEFPEWVDHESTGIYTDKYDAWFQAVDRYS